MINDQLRFFGVIERNGRTGYAHDFYPEEHAGCVRYYGKRIIGEFDNEEDAYAAVKAEMERRAADA